MWERNSVVFFPYRLSWHPNWPITKSTLVVSVSSKWSYVCALVLPLIMWPTPYIYIYIYSSPPSNKAACTHPFCGHSHTYQTVIVHTKRTTLSTVSHRRKNSISQWLKSHNHTAIPFNSPGTERVAIASPGLIIVNCRFSVVKLVKIINWSHNNGVNVSQMCYARVFNEWMR